MHSQRMSLLETIRDFIGKAKPCLYFRALLDHRKHAMLRFAVGFGRPHNFWYDEEENDSVTTVVPEINTLNSSPCKDMPLYLSSTRINWD